MKLYAEVGEASRGPKRGADSGESFHKEPSETPMSYSNQHYSGLYELVALTQTAT